MKYILLICFACITNVVFANEKVSPADVKAVENYFQASFAKSMTTNDISVQESEIPGFVDVMVNDKLFYFHIQSQLIFSGEVYDKTGNSLTKATISKHFKKKLEKINKPALILNAGKNLPKIIEFTDPDCPYCIQANSLFEQYPAERHIYFTTRIHPQAQKKVIHILCAKDKEKAMSEIYNQQVTEFNHCKEGLALAELSEKSSNEMSVSGTPTFYIEGNLIRGFNQQQLVSFLNSKQ